MLTLPSAQTEADIGSTLSRPDSLRLHGREHDTRHFFASGPASEDRSSWAFTSQPVPPIGSVTSCFPSRSTWSTKTPTLKSSVTTTSLPGPAFTELPPTDILFAPGVGISRSLPGPPRSEERRVGKE